jgi:hypothetical protein
VSPSDPARIEQVRSRPCEEPSPALVRRAGGSGDLERDVAVASRRIRVGADLVGALGQLLRCGALDARDVDRERDRQLEAARNGRTEADLRGDGGVRQLDLLAARHRLQRAVEAGGVASGEELLRVRRVAGAAELLLGRASATSSTPSDVRLRPLRPSPVAVACAS